ncbi:hypothetical protein YV76_004714 [Salmonella enterica subsp. enterica]|nr:hypothetical protein [Salmonella enterica subsp. enterica]
MSDKLEIYTGLYLFGDVGTNSSFGGVSGRIKLPGYKKEILFYLNDKYKHEIEKIDNSVTYNFNVSELESLYFSLGRLINDIRKLESLSKKNLLREEAYISSE